MNGDEDVSVCTLHVGQILLLKEFRYFVLHIAVVCSRMLTVLQIHIRRDHDLHRRGYLWLYLDHGIVVILSMVPA